VAAVLRQVWSVARKEAQGQLETERAALGTLREEIAKERAEIGRLDSELEAARETVQQGREALEAERQAHEQTRRLGCETATRAAAHRKGRVVRPPSAATVL